MTIIHSLKTKTKDVIASRFSCFNYPIIVNSYGRSGSTVLTKSIVDSAIHFGYDTVREWAIRTINQSAWDLENLSLRNGILYKTHDYPPAHDPVEGARMLYTYADPVDVVLSLLRLFEERDECWMKEHYSHLKVPYPEKFENIIKQDQLYLEKHLESWLHEERFPIAFIRYESMWDHSEEISDFLGFDVDLPPFRERKARMQNDEALYSQLKNNYTSLRKKIESLPPFFVENADF